METKGRIGRSAFAASVLLATIVASGLVPSPAVAETQSRTAPYDFGKRCTGGYPPGSALCESDPIAMMTGAITASHALVCPILIPLGDCNPVFSESSVGIFVDVVEAGSLTATVDAEAFGAESMFVCVMILPSATPDDRTCDETKAGDVELSHEANLPSAGRYEMIVFAFTRTFVAGHVGPSGGGAVIEMISYEVML